MASQRRKADSFRRMHRGKHILLLPNAWDVPSARMFENEGFGAVATSSAGLMVSHGYPDGEDMDLREMAEAVARISSALSVPLSSDIVGGYGSRAAIVRKTALAVIRAGAVGVNIEDLDHSAGKLVPLDMQLRKLEAVRKAGEDEGVPLVVNARTDALRHAPGSGAERFREAVRRAKAFRDWGADCVYPMGLAGAREIRDFVSALDCPVNVMLRKGLPDVGELEDLGIARLSFGPAASYATMGLLRRASREILKHGTFSALTEGAISFEELNALALRRK